MDTAQKLNPTVPTLPPARKLRSPDYDVKYGLAKKRRREPWNIAKGRVTDIEKIIRYRFDGLPIPHWDPDADAYVRLVAHHLARYAPGAASLRGWCNRWAPHFPPEEIAKIAGEAYHSPQFFSADKAAEVLRLTFQERTAVGLRTIGSIDVNVHARRALSLDRKQERDRNYQTERRRRAGAVPRDQYLAQSLSQTRPWEPLGISERTWRRRRKTLPR